MKMRKKIITAIILLGITLCLTFVCFVSLEGLARINYKESRIDKITKIIYPHPEKFWIGRPDYRGDFFGAYVNHNNSGLREERESVEPDILVMGGSPSYGWGVEKENTYSFLIQKELGNKVLNASVIGYSSFQGKLLLKELLSKYRPKSVILSYVINDIDRYRFLRNSALSDKNVKNYSLKEQIRDWINDKFYLGKYLRSFMIAADQLPLIGTTRVSESDYEANYREMIELCLSKGATPVLLKMPVELYKQKVGLILKSYLGKTPCNLIEDQENTYNCLVSDGGRNLSKVPANELRKLFGIIFSRKVKLYHDILEKLSVEYKIKVADPVNRFESSDQYLFLDKRMDPIHPNEHGHQIIADSLLNAL